MFKKILSLIVVICFFLTTLSPLPQAHADAVLDLPAPGTMVDLSPVYEPALIKGLTVHKDNPFVFDFILDTGNDLSLRGASATKESLKSEGDRLVKYFFACLTIPEKDLWVNLSPYEKDRMVPQALGQTALGRDLLSQDYILKQLTASLIYPEKNLGKAFWDRVYTKARQEYGTTKIPVNTFNKVWIVADKANVYEHGQTAFVISGHLKVMLEEDYLALKKHAVILSEAKQSNTIGSQIVRQIILPEIENEVNTGKNFSTLRQIFNSLILATWYKKNLKKAILNLVYADKSTVKGVNLADPSVKEQIYKQYLKAYKKGVFNYIKEDAQPDGQTIPRKYFSGGFESSLAMVVSDKPADAAQVHPPTGDDWNLNVGLNISGVDTASSPAMLTSDQQEIVEKFITDNKKYVTDIGRDTVAQIITELHSTPPAYSFDPFEDLVVSLLNARKIKIQRGSDKFFDDLKSTYGIDVQSVHYGNTIIIRSGVLDGRYFESGPALTSLSLVRQSAIMLGLSSSTVGVLEKMYGGQQMNEDEREIIQDDMDAMERNQELLARSNIIPPITIISTLAIILVTANVNIDPETKHKIIKVLHFLSTTVLGAHLAAGFNQMIKGQTAKEFLDGINPAAGIATIYAALSLAIMGGVVAPLFTMNADPYLSSGGILGSAALFVWAWKQRSLKKFLENKDITLTRMDVLGDMYQNYQNFWEISAKYPAAAAIGAFMTGIYLNSGEYSGEHWWLKAAFLFFGQMIVEGLSRYNPKAMELAEQSRRSFFDRKVTDGLRKAIGGDKFNNFLLYLKPAWYIAFYYWMVLRPETSLPQFLQNLYQPGWHAFSYMAYTAVGAASAGAIFGIEKFAQWRTKQKRLKVLLQEAAGSPVDPHAKMLDMETRVKDIIANVIESHQGVEVGRESIQPGVFLGDLGIDSLGKIELMIALEFEFDITKISDDDMNKMETVGGVIDYIAREKGLSHAMISAAQFSLESDREMKTALAGMPDPSDMVALHEELMGLGHRYEALTLVTQTLSEIMSLYPNNGAGPLSMMSVPQLRYFIAYMGKVDKFKDVLAEARKQLSSKSAAVSEAMTAKEALLKVSYARTFKIGEVYPRETVVALTLNEGSQPLGRDLRQQIVRIINRFNERPSGTYKLLLAVKGDLLGIFSNGGAGINIVNDLDQWLVTETSDHAMSPGGIDLNTSNGMQWTDNKDGQGVQMNVDPAMVARVRHEGINSLSPVIYKITPISSIGPLIGLPLPIQD